MNADDDVLLQFEMIQRASGESLYRASDTKEEMLPNDLMRPRNSEESYILAHNR